MRLNDYQKRAMTTCMETSANPLYMLFMLGEEVGELQGKFSKAIRKGWISFDGNKLIFHPKNANAEELMNWLDLVKKEIGDCLWGIAGITSQMDWSLEDVAVGNLDKLAARKAAGTIVGEGDGIERGK
jgi:NTP pyrophosphatase (non-canonical NTP hydrolase)